MSFEEFLAQFLGLDILIRVILFGKIIQTSSIIINNSEIIMAVAPQTVRS